MGALLIAAGIILYLAITDNDNDNQITKPKRGKKRERVSDDDGSSSGRLLHRRQHANLSKHNGSGVNNGISYQSRKNSKGKDVPNKSSRRKTPSSSSQTAPEKSIDDDHSEHIDNEEYNHNGEKE